MPGKRNNHTVRITFRVTPEERAALEELARRKGFGGNVSKVVRNLLRVRVRLVRELLRERRGGNSVGDEIREMFRSYEDDGRGMSWPPDINKRT